MQVGSSAAGAEPTIQAVANATGTLDLVQVGSSATGAEPTIQAVAHATGTLGLVQVGSNAAGAEPTIQTAGQDETRLRRLAPWSSMSMPTSIEVFEDLLDVPPDERARRLDAACAGNDGLRTQVLALLVAHEHSDGFLEPPALAGTPQNIGPWRLLRQLGAGGMGVVYLAERSDGAFEQVVAVKLLPGRFQSAEARRRVEAERHFLAALDHPNVARILDGGTTAEGQPYVVMEHVDGESIDAFVRHHGLDLRARILLFCQVLAAVDAAHRALIVHRDIKPGNVLVTRQGQAKLLDFGIAKSLDAGLGGDSTRTGMQAMTPQYASPEQLAGRPLTTACDVYALGLLLHELVTGARAYPVAGMNLYELERWLTTHAPTRPSAQVDALALGLSARVAQDWRRQLARDLDQVVLKARDPEPARRYASARAFADDLVRWLENRPVLARGGGRAYRLGKFLRRHRVQVAIAALALGAVVTGTTVALQQGWRAAREAERAQRANAFLGGIIGYANPRVSGSPVTLVEALDHAAAQIPQELAGQPELEGDIRQALGEAYLGQERTDAAREQLTRAVELRRAEAGNPYAASLTALAMLQWRLGETDAAEALLRQALAACTNDRAGNIQKASVLGDFAGFLGDQGRFADALPMAEEAIARIEGVNEVSATNRAATWNNLATSYYGVGRLEDAYAAFDRAATIFRQVEPLPELELSVNYNNQAVLLHRMGRLDEAIAQAEASIALKRKVMGPDYPQLVRPLSHLAQFQSEAGRHADAGKTMAEALRLAPLLYPTGDADLADLQVRAARIALAAGDGAAAAGFARTAGEIDSKLAPDARRDAEVRDLLDQAQRMTHVSPTASERE